jgi:glyoxylase-like metal-dependent hydrolase (beta-lactamase superfamily II)
MEVQQLRPGLWRWTGLHPEWKPSDGGPDGWEQEVGCVYAETEDAVVLFDPLAPPEDEERFWAALDRDVERLGRPVVVMVTCEWHERSAAVVAERYGAVRTVIPDGVEPIPVLPVEETLYWLPAYGALVAGDALIGVEGGGGVRLLPESWMEGRTTPDEMRALLASVLELPVELVLVSHGEPVLEGGRDALARALAG